MSGLQAVSNFATPMNKQWRIMYFQFLDRVECKFRGDVAPIW